VILSNEMQMGRPQSDGLPDDAHSAVSSLDDEACEWVERFAHGHGRRADVAALKQWMARSAAHAEAFDRISRTWTSLEPVGRKLAAKGLVSSRPPRQGRTAASAHAGIGRRVFIGGALAASAAGAAVMVAHPPLELWPSWSELRADFRTNPGEQRQVTLADQVSIDLNTRTSIAVRSAGAEAQLIAGEAMISSPPQIKTPFTLLAADGRVVTAGARFNVRIDGQAVCVTCLAGDVRVEQRGSILSLPVGQQVRYSDRGMSQPATVDPAVVAAWQDGIVVFESTPIADVIIEVNRYRPGKIILTNKDLGRRVFDARLRIENIGNVVRQIELAFGAHATELPGGIMLLG
jgi:transmembrane sensor